MRQLLILLFLSSLLFGCSKFKLLSNEMKEIDSLTHEYTLTLSEPVLGSAVVIEQIKDISKSEIHGYDAIIGTDRTSLQMSNDIQYLLLFEDKNKDLTPQLDEAFSLIDLHDYKDKADIDIKLEVNSKAFPKAFVDRSLASLLKIELELVAIGKVVKLTASPFDKRNAALGMWQPLTFMLESNTGLYFLSDYDPNKIPILFVHGINATASELTPLIEKVDQSKYQVWVFNYPSGLSLSLISKGLGNVLYTSMSELHFEQMHIVAHSMGGLVVENYMRQCNLGQLCDFVNSVSTISSPFGGVTSAQKGVEYSPVVMPAWVDLNPDSVFIRELFDHKEKKKTPHFIAFGYNSGNLLSTQSHDGVIYLSSQLSRKAQLHAEMMRGYDEDHLSILSNNELFEDLSNFWLETESIVY